MLYVLQVIVYTFEFVTMTAKCHHQYHEVVYFSPPAQAPRYGTITSGACASGWWYLNAIYHNNDYIYEREVGFQAVFDLTFARTSARV